MSWPEVRFEDLYAEPSRNGVYKPKELHGAGVKIVNMGELFSHDVIAGQEMNRLAMTEQEIQRAGLQDGDLLFGRRSLVEEGAGKASIVEGVVEPTTFESSLIRVRLDHSKANPWFVFYWLKSHLGRGRIRAIVTGTNVKGIKGSVLKSVMVPCPERGVQNALVNKIRPYDDLIENNRRRIQLLEESARLLYKEWFVHLRFPGHEHVKVINGVPEGWSRKRLGDIATLNYGKALKKDARNPGPYPVFGSSGVVGEHDEAFAKGPSIIIGRKGNVGSVYWSDKGFYPIDTVYFITSKQSSLFLYHALKNTQFISTDVAVPGLNRNLAHSREIFVPNYSVFQVFEEYAQDIQAQVAKLCAYNERLAKARDLLLPKLMSGELAA